MSERPPQISSCLQFEILEDVSNFALCEVIAVHVGAVRQKKLAPMTKNLANRLSLSSRYYLKDNRKTESIVQEHVAQVGNTGFRELVISPGGSITW